MSVTDGFAVLLAARNHKAFDSTIGYSALELACGVVALEVADGVVVASEVADGVVVASESQAGVVTLELEGGVVGWEGDVVEVVDPSDARRGVVHPSHALGLGCPGVLVHP